MLDLTKPLVLEVAAFRHSNKKFDILHDFISSMDDAILLARYEMERKESDDLIVIFPGWNCGLSTVQTAYVNDLIERRKRENDDD